MHRDILYSCLFIFILTFLVSLASPTLGTAHSAQQKKSKQPAVAIAKHPQQKSAVKKHTSTKKAAPPSKQTTTAAKPAPTVQKSSAKVSVKKSQKPSHSRTVTKKKEASRSTKQVASAYYTPSGDIEGKISSKSVMLMDAQSGETIFAKSPDNPRQPASTIKIVTALIALKSLKPDDILDVSRKASDMPSSKIFLDPKKSYRANDLINAVLLASANDASVALAENIAGSEEKFANMMTMSARIWGAENTICRTASGLTAEGQHSTARDLATLFRYAMQHEDFARRVREKKISTSYGKTLLNHNKALWRIDGAVAGKTGYTVAARQTYVGQFSRNGQTLIVAVMGSESMWGDVRALVEYGFSKKQAQMAKRKGMGVSADAVSAN